MKVLRAALLLLLASPAAAHAAGPTMVARDVPLASAPRQLASVSAPRFTMIGLHWQGRGTVDFRTRGLDGRWSAWRPAAPEDEDRPDAGFRERTVPGWQIGNPYWMGPSDRLEVRPRGKVSGVRAFYLWSPADGVPPRMLSIASAPPIVPRLSWGANESIRRAGPYFADSLRFAVVHHTAGSNNYTRAESAAIARGIQVYHVKANGWNDLGYNFLVDKYGQIFEGRFGGIERNVVGAHAEGFNTGSVGVAVMGTYTGSGISPAARDALARLLAWRLDVAHVDPLSTLSWTSGGNARFPRGVPVFLRAVSGHRDTGFTACPGNALYAQLNDLAGRIGEIGLPKLYAPSSRGGPGGPVRFTGRLSSPLPWAVTVTDSAGTRIAAGSGAGTAVDWTWEAAAAPPGAYSWAIEAGPAVRAARGTIGGRAGTLSLQQAAAEPTVVSPNGDGVADTSTISFVLGAPATVAARLLDAGGTVVATLLAPEARPAGGQTVALVADAVPDGAYTVVIVAQNAAGREVSAQVPLVVTRALGYVGASAATVSPNGDGRFDRLSFSFLLGSSAPVRVRIVRGTAWVANVVSGPRAPGQHVVDWDGRKPHGRLRDGDYEVEVTASTELGPVSQRVAFAVDTRPPTVRLFSLRPLRVRVLEPVRLIVQLNGRWRTIDRRRPGLVPLGSPAAVRALRVVAEDAAGNRSEPLIHRR
ncbi:MAG: N-acetylmuramoyl-L-alanine amidase [Thermoleophilia bacterium]|nr:N-acetylmuramoyl-L-alanine amidase [Thermoleophilia bacterium]